MHIKDEAAERYNVFTANAQETWNAWAEPALTEEGQQFENKKIILTSEVGKSAGLTMVRCEGHSNQRAGAAGVASVGAFCTYCSALGLGGTYL